jgi:hypothetical protein
LVFDRRLRRRACARSAKCINAFARRTKQQPLQPLQLLQVTEIPYQKKYYRAPYQNKYQTTAVSGDRNSKQKNTKQQPLQVPEIQQKSQSSPIQQKVSPYLFLEVTIHWLSRISPLHAAPLSFQSFFSVFFLKKH